MSSTNEPRETAAAETIPEREEQLAEVLQECGILGPLLSIAIEQVASEAQERASDSPSRDDPPIRAALRKAFPSASEDELDDLERCY